MAPAAQGPSRLVCKSRCVYIFASAAPRPAEAGGEAPLQIALKQFSESGIALTLFSHGSNPLLVTELSVFPRLSLGRSRCTDIASNLPPGALTHRDARLLRMLLHGW